MTDLQSALNTIEKEIAFIERNIESFQAKFCRKDVFDIYGIFFSGKHIKFNTVENSGMHAVHEKTILQYLKWKDSL